MTQKQLETHCTNEGVDIISRENIDSLISFARSYSQKGKYRNCLRILGDRGGYRFVAYPGPAVVESGRAEHEPLHFHVNHNQYRELRILTEDFSEMDGFSVPRNLKIIWRVRSIRDNLIKQTKSVYETGKLAE